MAAAGPVADDTRALAGATSGAVARVSGRSAGADEATADRRGHHRDAGNLGGGRATFVSATTALPVVVVAAPAVADPTTIAPRGAGALVPAVAVTTVPAVVVVAVPAVVAVRAVVLVAAPAVVVVAVRAVVVVTVPAVVVVAAPPAVVAPVPVVLVAAARAVIVGRDTDGRALDMLGRRSRRGTPGTDYGSACTTTEVIAIQMRFVKLLTGFSFGSEQSARATGAPVTGAVRGALYGCNTAWGMRSSPTPSSNCPSRHSPHETRPLLITLAAATR